MDHVIARRTFLAGAAGAAGAPVMAGAMPSTGFSQRGPKGIAPRPPMGWNSWDCFGSDVTEAEVMANAMFMAKNLKQLGWDHLVIDLGWYGKGLTARGKVYQRERPPMVMDEWGRLIPNPEMHPSAVGERGFKPIADRLHAIGLKLGIHIMRGVPWTAVEARTPIKGAPGFTAADIAVDAERCSWFKGMYTIDMGHSAGQAYYDSLAELYASWGVDFVKADDMGSWAGHDGSSPYRVDEVEGLSSALARCGRPITFSLSPGPALLANRAHLRRHAHMWRISMDFWDTWPALRRQFDHIRLWARHAAPGGWPDADMLPLGRIGIRAEEGDPRPTRFTHDEQTTLMTLWSMVRSPLMFGGHLPDSDAFTLSLISNPEVIAVNQESHGAFEADRTDDTIAWAAKADNGDVYAALFNLGEAAVKVGCSFKKLGAVEANNVRDLWSRSALGRQTSTLELEVPAHGARLVRLAGA